MVLLECLSHENRLNRQPFVWLPSNTLFSKFDFFFLNLCSCSDAKVWTSLVNKFQIVTYKKNPYLTSHWFLSIIKLKSIFLFINHFQTKQVLANLKLLLHNVSIHNLDGLGLSNLLLFHGFSWFQKTSTKQYSTFMHTRR